MLSKVVCSVLLVFGENHDSRWQGCPVRWPAATGVQKLTTAERLSSTERPSGHSRRNQFNRQLLTWSFSGLHPPKWDLKLWCPTWPWLRPEFPLDQILKDKDWYWKTWWTTSTCLYTSLMSNDHCVTSARASDVLYEGPWFLQKVGGAIWRSLLFSLYSLNSTWSFVGEKTSDSPVSLNRAAGVMSRSLLGH